MPLLNAVENAVAECDSCVRNLLIAFLLIEIRLRNVPAMLRFALVISEPALLARHFLTLELLQKKTQLYRSVESSR